MSEEIKGELLTAKGSTSAKEISKWSMVIASFWIGILSLIKAFWPLFVIDNRSFGLDMGDIIISGVALAAIFSPIYFSIFLDKVKEIKIGGTK